MMHSTIAIAALLAATAAVPQPAGPRLDARTAQAAVAGCVARAAERGQTLGIAVVDVGGRPIATLRMDGAGFGKMDFAMAKAQAAAAWGFPTAAMEEGARTTPGFAAAPHVVTVAGGVPIWSSDGRVRLGAIGVSGAAPAEDSACAEAGIAAAGLRSSRTAD